MSRASEAHLLHRVGAQAQLRPARAHHQHGPDGVVEAARPKRGASSTTGSTSPCSRVRPRSSGRRAGQGDERSGARSTSSTKRVSSA